MGAQSITGALFEHWAGVARRAQGAAPNASDTTAVVEEVMTFLVSSDWVLGEARYLHIRLSAREVHRGFDHIRREQFPKRGEFRAFLKASGQTVADLLLRVRLNLLAQSIQRRAVAGHRGARARQRAYARFVGEFGTRWRARTYCAPAYAVRNCGHVQTAL